MGPRSHANDPGVADCRRPRSFGIRRQFPPTVRPRWSAWDRPEVVHFNPDRPAITVSPSGATAA